MAYTNNNNTTTWVVDNFAINLKEYYQVLTLEVIEKQNKDLWRGAIKEEQALLITEKFFGEKSTLDVVKKMIIDALDKKTPEITFQISFEDNGNLVLALNLKVYIISVRTFRIVLPKEQVDEVWKLKQIIEDLRAKQEKLVCENSGPFAGSQLEFVEGGRINLPKGKWLIEISFNVTTQTANIFANYYFQQGEGEIVEKKRCLNNLEVGYPITVFERQIVNQSNQKGAYFILNFKFQNKQSTIQTPPHHHYYGFGQPEVSDPTSFSNVILTATRIN